MLADREHAVFVVRGDLDLLEADLSDGAHGEAIRAALDELLDHAEVEHHVAVEQDEAIVLDVLAGEQERVRVVRAAEVRVGDERDIEAGEPAGHGIAHHVLEVAGADHELIEPYAQEARDGPPQDRDSAHRQQRLRRIVGVGAEPSGTPGGENDGLHASRAYMQTSYTQDVRYLGGLTW